MNCEEFTIDNFNIGDNLFIEASAGTGKTYEEFTIDNFNIGDNLFIVASAGTGKTYNIELLVDKMINEGLKLSNILIVTFTEKAAGELRHRIREKLEKLETGLKSNDVNKEKYRNALSQINDAPIYTIHSFCKNTLDEFAYEANAAMKLDIVPEEQVVKIIEKLVRDEWSNDEEFKKLLNDELDLAKFIKDCKNAVIQYLLANKPDTDKDKDKDDKSWAFILNSLEKIIEIWNEYKRQNNLQSYGDMIDKVHHEVCKENSLLLQKLREKYKYVIIDEFQDTNQKQWDIFKKIFLDSDTNHIIVVGDPKQSIYAFQGADVTVYKKAIGEIKNQGKGEGYCLKRNYRSTNILIEACNELFGKVENTNKFFIKEDFTDSDLPENEDDYRRQAIYKDDEGKEITVPLWISPKLEKNEYFAKFAVKQILKCCGKDENGKTRLQIAKKDKTTLENVDFSDFAVLGRTRSELKVMENALRSVGIPFVRYKDTNLFSGKEAFSWITMLKALNVSDFSGRNRKILNSLLVSDFIRIKLQDVENDSLLRPTVSPMKEILAWRQLANKRCWAELHERIYADTEIDKYLYTPETLQSLTKLKQIGNYIFDYLYEHKASLDEMIKHLEGLYSANQYEDEADDNLVERGSDFKAVQLMTCHASKGLSFPVVIALGGMKDYWKRMPGPYLYHEDQKDQKHLGFDKPAKELKEKDDFEEFRRLMYVAYTRAESLLILPCYKTENEKKEDKPKSKSNKSNNKTENINNFDFIREAINRIVDDNEKFVYTSSDNEEKNENRNENDAELLGSCKYRGDINIAHIAEVQNSLGGKQMYQYSYSSLTSKKKRMDNHEEQAENDNELNDLSDDRIDKDEIDNENEATASNYDSDKRNDIDLNPIRISYKQDYKSECNVITPNGYPSGARLGNAIHDILEKTVFSGFGLFETEDKSCEDIDEKSLIEECFADWSLNTDKADWNEFTSKRIWHTLNAKLPEIKGNKFSGNSFKLNSLSEDKRKAEMEFNLNADGGGKYKNLLRHLCKGFIDLLFVRGEYYSILDWKSDVLKYPEEADEDKNAYSDIEIITRKVDEEYSIQRVLYSYFLIKWLKQFYSKHSEEEIFEQHFGGIYYVFVRGCHADSSNGVYAQTWNSFKDLEDSFNKIKNLMGKSSNEK